MPFYGKKSEREGKRNFTITGSRENSQDENYSQL